MPRHKNDGLKYFSFDVDFFHADKRIVKLHKRFGNDGIVFYIYLLTEIYRNGYYARWNEDLIDDAIDLNLTEGLIEQMMTFFKGRGLIVEVEPEGTEVDEEESNRTDTIITSPGIQKRYQAAVKSLRRDIYVDSKIWLLSEEETESFIKVTKNEDKSRKNEDKYRKNEDKSRKNDTKENKIKEKKENEIKRNENIICAEPEPPHAPPVISLTLNDKSLHDIFQSDIDAWSELYPAADIMQELRKMKGWLDSNPTKRKTKRGIKRFINSWLARTQDSGGSRTPQKQPDKQEKLQNLLRSIREDEENEHNGG